MDTQSSLKVRVQKLGTSLSNMVMPNIGAFIAWGVLTSLFIPTGWLPNENLATIVGPAITYLLPLLIGYTGGYMVHGQRGAVVGAIATFGAIAGAEVPMFIGAISRFQVFVVSTTASILKQWWKPLRKLIWLQPLLDQTFCPLSPA